jgi:hypothetical protein
MRKITKGKDKNYNCGSLFCTKDQIKLLSPSTAHGNMTH